MLFDLKVLPDVPWVFAICLVLSFQLLMSQEAKSVAITVS